MLRRNNAYSNGCNNAIFQKSREEGPWGIARDLFNVKDTATDRVYL